MIVSFTYDVQKIVGQRLANLPQVNRVWLQARKMQTQDGVEKIVIQNGQDYQEVGWNDTDGISVYIRDVGNMSSTPADTDACSNEFSVTQKVRVVAFGENVKLNMQKLSKQIVSQLSGQAIDEIWFDPQEIIREELSDVKIPISPSTYIFAVDFTVQDFLLLDACLQDIDCSLEDLELCSDVVVAAPAFVPIGGCRDITAYNYNENATYDNGTCEYEVPSEFMASFVPEDEQPITVLSGANIFGSYDAQYIEGWINQAIELDFGAFYLTFSGMSNSNAAKFNNFFAAVPTAQKALFFPILGFDQAFTYVDWAKNKFGTLMGYAMDQESQLSSKEAAWLASLSPAEQAVVDATVAGGGTIDDGLQLVYISRSQATMAHFPDDEAWWDVPNVWTQAATTQARKAAIRPLNDTDVMRQYEQVSPDSVVYLQDQHTYNLSLINQYIGTLVPSYLNKIFVDAGTKFPNINKIVILQRHSQDSGTTALSDALNNILISEFTRSTIANTDKYRAWFWMRFGDLMRPSGAASYQAIKRTNKCYKFDYVIPVTSFLSGVSMQGYRIGANQYAVLFTNQTGVAHTVTVSDINIPGKTITGVIAYDRGWSATLGGATTNQTGTDTVIEVPTYGNVLAVFNVV